jgi:peptide/nickel transport system substrate-binding protein
MVAVATAMPAAALAQDEEVTPGGTLVVAADSEPVNLNPAMVASNGVFFVSSKVVEPLAEMDQGGALRPLLATSWQGSEDGMTFTVNLREGVTWHDGVPFTSADVAFSAMESGRRKFPAVLRQSRPVDTPDDHTAVFNFSQPMPSQLFEIAMPASPGGAQAPPEGTELNNPDAQSLQPRARGHGALRVRRAPARRALQAHRLRRLLG